MKAANPYLNFAGNTEEAFEFYRSVFGGEFLAVVRFRDFGDSMGQIPEQDRDKIAHIALPLGADNVLMGTDTLESFGQSLELGNNSYIALTPDDPDEAKRLFDGLADGGEVEMELQETQWAEAYGSFKDRFGVQWMVNYEGKVSFSAAEQG